MSLHVVFLQFNNTVLGQIFQDREEGNFLSEIASVFSHTCWL